jgi:hypothetical protein
MMVSVAGGGFTGLRERLRVHGHLQQHSVLLVTHARPIVGVHVRHAILEVSTHASCTRTTVPLSYRGSMATLALWNL